MGKVVKLTAAEQQAILGRLQAGESVSATARRVGRGKATVSRLARAYGFPLERARTERLARAAREFDHITRLEAVNLLAGRIVALLEEDDDLSAKDLRDAAVALGVSIDKARLERNESTQNVAHNVAVHVYLPDNGRGLPPPQGDEPAGPEGGSWAG